ncbi:hypothetical protein HRbin16_03010 [bacterium HR16]|nr:hypothetical protein HRbin16_03010 [bacterium HR16]
MMSPNVAGGFSLRHFEEAQPECHGYGSAGDSPSPRMRFYRPQHHWSQPLLHNYRCYYDDDCPLLNCTSFSQSMLPSWSRKPAEKSRMKRFIALFSSRSNVRLCSTG